MLALPSQGVNKVLKIGPIVRMLCRSLTEASSAVIKKLKLGENLGDVRRLVYQLLAPVVHNLEARVARGEEQASLLLAPEQAELHQVTKLALEATRSEWCGFLNPGEMNDMPQEAREVAVDLMTVILESGSPGEDAAADKAAEGRMGSERMAHQEDLTLNKAYAEAVNLARKAEGGGGDRAAQADSSTTTTSSSSAAI